MGGVDRTDHDLHVFQGTKKNLHMTPKGFLSPGDVVNDLQPEAVQIKGEKIKLISLPS